MKVELSPTTFVDVCSGEKKIQIEVLINEIFAKDSLLGFDLTIEYDADKILIDQVLTDNTITAQIIRSGGFKYFGQVEPGAYRAVAVLPDGSGFLKGKVPLLVFSGKYIGECEGIASIRISDFEPEYYRLFQNRLLKFDQEKYIVGKVLDLTGRELKLEYDKTDLQIESNDSIKDINLFIRNPANSRISSATINLTIENPDLLKILSINSYQSGVKIEGMDLGDSNAIIKVLLNQNMVSVLPSIQMKLQVLKDIKFTTSIFGNIIETNKCSCIKKFASDSVVITKIKKDTVTDSAEKSDNQEINTVIIENSDIIKLTSNYLIDEVVVYNILGVELYRRKLENPEYETYLPRQVNNNGVEIIEISSKTENKKKYIKFIK